MSYATDRSRRSSRHRERDAVTAPVQSSPRTLRVVGGVGTVLTLGWTSLAVFLAGRGLGAGNEGFYLLSYERWDHSPRTFTGAQYLFGPLLDLLGHDVGRLRLAGLALLLIVHACFGVAFARWLRLQRPDANPSKAWEYCIASLIVSSAVIAYSWLPPTPGYNAVTMLGCLVLVALLLVGLRCGQVGEPVPLWAGMVWGLTSGAMLLAKPPVAVTVVALTVGSAYLLHTAGVRLWRLVLSSVVGLLLFSALVQWLVAPWRRILPPMRDELDVVSTHSHPPIEVLSWYAESSFALAKAVTVVCAPTLLAVLLLRVVGRASKGRRAAVALLGLAASLALLAGAGGLRAGADNVLAFTSGIVAMLVLVVASATPDLRRLPRTNVPTVGVLALLAFVPLLQGVGTNNALYATAVNGSAMWIALMLLATTRLRPGHAPRFAVSATATLAAVVLAVVVGVDGLTHDATGRSLISGPMAPVPGSIELSTLRLPAAEAAEYASLRQALGIQPGSTRPMLAFGELSQYVLALGGRPIGEAWYTSFDDGLNGSDLRAACRHGNPWGQDQPLVVANREPSSDELAAWRTCGVDFTRDYVDVTPPSTPGGVRVLSRQPTG